MMIKSGYLSLCNILETNLKLGWNKSSLVRLALTSLVSCWLLNQIPVKILASLLSKVAF